jgi:hypothetical protein
VARRSCYERKARLGEEKGRTIAKAKEKQKEQRRFTMVTNNEEEL